MLKCKIKSIKLIGKQMTYNVTMKGNQHNYKIVNNGFGIYSRNSHSASYAMLAYQTAWLKYYYPLEFMCNLLSSEINNSDKGLKLEAYQREARRMNLIINNPDINKSGAKYKIATFMDDTTGSEKDGIRTPLTIVSGVGDKAVRSIIENQPFADLKDFLHTIDTRTVNSKVFGALVEAGCMKESWKLGKETLLNQYTDVKSQVDKEKNKRKKQIERMEQYGGANIFSKMGGKGIKL